MTILLSGAVCTKCVGELQDFASAPRFDVALNQAGTFQHMCPKGHMFQGVVQNHRHELIFELAMRALHDDDSRGAVFNAASALDSFYLFFASVALRALDKKPDVSRPTVAAWLKFTERQTGAFAFAHIVLFDELPPNENDKQRKLRNDVIHSGRVPEPAEAREYLRHVYDTIVPITERLCSAHEDAIHRETTAHLTHARGALKSPTGGVSSMLLGTVICSMNTTSRTQSFDDACTHFEAYELPRLVAHRASQIASLLAAK